MKKYTLKEKAYKINLDRIDKGYLFCEQIFWAKSIGKAKKELMEKIQYEGYQPREGGDITYLNIPVLRAKEHDLYEFEGNDITIYKIEKIIEERERILELNKTLEDPTIKFCYIRKRGSYYRPNCCGYTEFEDKAGVYTKKDAVSQAMSCDELTIRPVDIEQHNKMINESIYELQKQLISAE